MRNRAAFAIATWFGCGWFPVGPGTAGSLAAVGIAYLLARYTGAHPWWFALLGIGICGPGIWAAGVAEVESKREDPGFVVVDEVAGQWLTLAGATVLNWKSFLLGFLLFRLFDIWKPPPARRLESLHGGLGIMADDVMAGIYGSLVLAIAGWFNFY
jgi:phosphatidylglycerophosphatase A